MFGPQDLLLHALRLKCFKAANLINLLFSSLFALNVNVDVAQISIS